MVHGSLLPLLPRVEQGFSLGGGGGAVQPPLPPSGAEFLEAPKAPRKIFGLN